MWDMIVSVLDHCLSFTLIKLVMLINRKKGMIYDAYVFFFFLNYICLVYIKIITPLHSFDPIIVFIPKDILFPKM